MLFVLIFVSSVCLGQDADKYWDQNIAPLLTEYDTYNIVGWSEDGLVAYTLYYSNDDHGMEDEYYEDYSLKIQDLKTDKILYTEYIEDDIYDNAILDEYNIVVDTSNKFHDSNFYEEGHYSIGIEQNYSLVFFEDIVYDIHETCRFPELNRHVLTSTIHVFMNYKNRRKKVGSLESEECYGVFWFSGYYKSPFEDRILLVFSSTNNQESSMSDTVFEFIGCSLNPNTFSD